MTARNPPMARGSGRSAHSPGRRPAAPYSRLSRSPGRVWRGNAVRLLDGGRTANPMSSKLVAGRAGPYATFARLLDPAGHARAEGLHAACCRSHRSLKRRLSAKAIFLAISTGLFGIVGSMIFLTNINAWLIMGLFDPRLLLAKKVLGL